MLTAAELRADLHLALRAAERAASAALRFFGRDTLVRYKAADQPVTKADLLADRVLHQLLIGERPGYGWLSEESADTGDRLRRDRVWVVDPIDGTCAFIEGRPEYVISIALVAAGAARIGVVLNPSTGELFHAIRGAGVHRNGRSIRVPESTGGAVLLASRAEIGRGEFDELGARWRVLPLGSTAYKMVKTLDGTGTAYLSRAVKSEWDVCAAALIVTEAGGTVTDVRGTSLQFNRPAPFVQGIVAGSPAAHRKLLEQCRVMGA